jgi:hypothetical protein
VEIAVIVVIFRFGNCFQEGILVQLCHKTENFIRFAGKLKVRHAFQVVKDLPYEDVDLFKCDRLVIASARTLLSQLL